MSEDKTPVVLVTGATDGIGRETALELARRGARVIVHGRSAEKVEATLGALRAVRPEAAHAPLVADLSRLAAVRAAPADLDRRGLSVDVLLNNAGVYMNERAVSADGFELTFAVNHLAPFALTHALLRAESGRRLHRIVNVSSMAHVRGTIDLDDLFFEKRRFDPYGAYAASKLANVLFTIELARRLPAGVTTNALHPGVVSTKLLTEGFGVNGSDSLADGARTSVRLALDPSLERATGGYYRNEKPSEMNPVAKDAVLGRRFYERSAELSGVAPLDPPA